MCKTPDVYVAIRACAVALLGTYRTLEFAAVDLCVKVKGKRKSTTL